MHRPDLVRGRYIALAAIFFAGPFLAIALVALFDSRVTPGEGVLAVLLTFVMMSAIPGAMAYFWWRYRRYGDSVCRLITLPGLIDGPFAADVDCALPPDAYPVIVRLKNMVINAGSGGLREAWSMEQRLEIPVLGARTVVPVRLSVPRHHAQVLPDMDRPAWKEIWFGGGAIWILEIEKKASGVDFLDSFLVPIYDLRPKSH